MNLLTRISTAVLTTICLSQPLFSAQKTINFKNQRGSILELTILADNKVEGFFTTAVASKACPQAINAKRPITGYVIGNVVSFSVIYPMCETALTVSGNFDIAHNTIDAMNILNRQATNVAHEGVGERFIGHDFYKKID